MKDASMGDLQVDIVGDGEEVVLSDDSDSHEPDRRMPRKTRYDVGFIFELLWRSRNSEAKGPRVLRP